VHVDLVGPLPVAADGLTYILTIIDRTSRWVEAVPLKEMSASACKEAFVSTWVARYGVPSTLTSDRGCQFVSDTWASLCDKLGIKHVTTTAYHPQATSLVERVRRQIKDALRARQAGADWPQHLPWVLLGLRAAPKEISGISSAEVVFGQQLILPGEVREVLEAPALEFAQWLASSQPPPTSQPHTYAEVAASSSSPDLPKAEFVYIKRGGSVPPLSSPYMGPFRVVQRGLKFFIVDLGGRHESVSVDRLKPHTGSAPLVAETPPERGRPRRI
jgi:hypothetical protein